MSRLLIQVSGGIIEAKQIVEHEYSEYEVLEIESKGKTFVFLITKEYLQQYIAYGNEIILAESTLNISFDEIPRNSQRNIRTPWSILWEADPNVILGNRNGNSEYGEKVKYAYHGMFKIDLIYRNIGLGSYLLDSLTLWAQKNFSQASVEISIIDQINTDVEESLIQHFYGKRNLEYNAKVSDLKTFITEAKHIKVTTGFDHLNGLKKKNNELNRNLNAIVEHNLKLCRWLIIKKRNYKLLLAISILASIALGWYLKGKFG